MVTRGSTPRVVMAPHSGLGVQIPNLLHQALKGRNIKAQKGRNIKAQKGRNIITRGNAPRDCTPVVAIYLT